MGSLCIEKELKAAAQTLDVVTIKAMDSCLRDLTTSGNPSLDASLMKTFKRLCRKSDDYVRYAFLLIMKQLKKPHSEIRLSAFQVVDELFNRSHAFREIVILHLQAFLALTAETEVKQPLPPPKSAAKKLKTDTLHAIKRWYDKYGQGYRQLVIGYDFLKDYKKVDFDAIEARNIAEQQRIDNEEKKKQKIMADKLTKVLKDIEESTTDIQNCAKEAESCLELLLPKPRDFLLLPTAGEHPDSTTEPVRRSQASNVKSTNDKAQCDGSHSSTSEETIERSKNSISAKGPESPGEVATDNVRDESLFCEREISVDNKTSGGLSEQYEIKLETHSAVLKDNHIEQSDSDNECGDSDSEDDLQVHGLTNPTRSVTIEIPSLHQVRVLETEDNQDVLRSLKDASKLINDTFIPKVIKWLEILGKNGAKQNDITSAIDLKVHLETIREKCVELKLVSVEKPAPQHRDSDEEEFEDVPEKEGFEPTIPSHLRKEYGLTSPSSSSRPEERLQRQSSRESSSRPEGSPSKGNSSSPHLYWNLKEREQRGSTMDPTSRTAALASIKAMNTDVLAASSSSSSSTPASAQQCSQTASTDKTKDAPVVEFGVDLAFWDNPDKMEVPSIVKLDSLHRFWNPKEVETEKPAQHDLAALRNRVFSYTGKFEPVKWKCRAPLPSGKLCERMDRLKCPFHGPVIPRDEEGNPTALTGLTGDTALKVETPPAATTSTDEELPPWRDPALQREIEQATGHDLGSTKSQQLLDKGKGKGKGKKRSNLTDLKAAKNTTRQRLENKVFKKSSLKRICSSLDHADYKRVRDKFGNQFNYQ